MRIVVLDYSGHIPQADLARSLAKLGHNVRHMYCSDYVSGRGAVEHESTDPKNLEFLNISIKISLFFLVIGKQQNELKTRKIYFKSLNSLRVVKSNCN
jgi:hypothetical protein